MKTVVGLYKTLADANKVKTALASEGYDSGDITVIDQSENNNSQSGSSYNTDNASSDASVGGRIKHFFSSLTGHDDESHSSYEQGVAGGGALVAVTVADEEAEDTAEILHSHGASDIQGGYGASSYGASGYRESEYGSAGYNAAGTTGSKAATDTTTSGEKVIPVVAEELQVGKREVERGGVRVYSRVVSEPVSESVSLHDERVVVDRHAVDRPATEADFATGTGAIEVTAMGEEAVVGKRSRVVEEILVGKQATDHVEEINDTVRHTEVEVEPTTTTTTGTTGTRFDR